MSQVLTAPTPATASSIEQSAYRKAIWHIVPFLFVCYLAAYLDRVNVGFAKLQMQSELGFSETVYGFGAGIFFLGYVLFEVPSNILMLRVGARLWIARIMITWGLISGAMALVHSAGVFYVLRFLLGVAEAGFIPGILLYLALWFPPARRGRISAIFLAAIPTASIIGGPLSGWVLRSVSGVWGMSGWQWLFVIETIPSLLLGIATIAYLRDRVDDVEWLDPAEKQVILKNMARESQATSEHSQLSQAFTDPRVWLLGAIYYCIVCGIYIVSFWLPSLIKRSGVADPLMIGLLTAVPYIAAIVVMVVVNASGDRLHERRWHTMLPALACAGGLLITGLFGDNTALAMVGLTLAAAGASTAQASFWCMPPAFLGGAAAAAGIAFVNSLGNIAGFVSNYFVGWLTEMTHSAAAALYVFSGIVALGAVMVVAIPKHLVNK